MRIRLRRSLGVWRVVQPHANFACDKCPAFYNTKDSLERHYSDKHSCRMDGSMIEEKSLECETCGKVFGVDKELQYHVYYCARKDEIAEIRAKKRQKDRLTASRAYPSVSPAGPNAKIAKDKSCPVCGLVTASMQSRNRHIQNKHPERYPACLDEVHVFVPTPKHLVARPFSCATCDMAVSSRAALSIHERRTHGANPTKMFYCDKCGNGYPLASELRKHEKRNKGKRMCSGRGCPSGSKAARPGPKSRKVSNRAVKEEEMEEVEDEPKSRKVSNRAVKEEEMEEVEDVPKSRKVSKRAVKEEEMEEVEDKEHPRR